MATAKPQTLLRMIFPDGSARRRASTAASGVYRMVPIFWPIRSAM
jgi:hypothetical protein